MKHTMHDVLSTPVLDLLRGRVAPMQFGKEDAQSLPNALTLVERSALPDPAKDLLKHVIRKTRLWRSEKRAVAEELVAHFADGLEAGRPADDLIQSFGNAVKAAKLIRRAKRRNRPLWWQIWYRSGQAVACFITIYIAAALLLLLSHPTPSVDYIAQINAVAASAPSGDTAWPIYRDVFTELNAIKPDDLKVLDIAIEDGNTRLVRPTDATWSSAVALVHSHEQMLAKARQAAAKPYFGLVVGTSSSFAPEDYAAVAGKPLPASSVEAQSRADELLQQATISVLLPHLAKMRELARIFTVDAMDAASRNDGQRVADDYIAMLGMAHHTREHPILISQLVGVGVCGIADDTIAWINQHYPQSIAAQRVAMLHAAAADPGLFTTDLSTEKGFVLDMIQRMYSDSGNGEGHLTPEGLQVLASLHGSGRFYPLGLGTTKLNGWLIAPLATAVVASREEVTNLTERHFSRIRQELREPLWVRLRQNPGANRDPEGLRSSSMNAVYYAPLFFLLPQLTRAGNRMDISRSVHEVTMVALALDVYHHKTGSYPDTLAQLVPHYLPEVPLDVSTGQPLCYRLKDGKPLLYGRGIDGKDGGGVWTPDPKTNVSGIPAKGDWILYPPPEPQ